MPINKQMMYWHWGRPPILLQFFYQRMNRYGLMRACSNWHGQVHETTWNTGVFHEIPPEESSTGNAMIYVFFRYKDDSDFLVRQVFMWDD